jgi:hypothetical protein
MTAQLRSLTGLGVVTKLLLPELHRSDTCPACLSLFLPRRPLESFDVVREKRIAVPCSRALFGGSGVKRNPHMNPSKTPVYAQRHVSH